MKLTQLYTSILAYCGLVPNSAGEIDTLLPGSEDGAKPTTIEGRRLVMPTKEQFANYHPEKVIVFHPLQEHIERGESEVVKHLRFQLNVRINMGIATLAAGLLEIAGSPAIHQKLTPEQRELLKAVPNANAKSTSAFLAFYMKNMKGKEHSSVINIFLKRSGTYQGVKHTRIGVVAFPYYETIASDASMKAAEKEDFVALMEYMFPGSSTDNEAYNSFSDSKDAPWLETLLKSSFNVTNRINELCELFEDFLNEESKMHFETQWFDAFDNLESFRAEISRIPSQKGNEGTIIVDGEERSTVEKPQAAQRVVPARQDDPSPYRTADPASYRIAETAQAAVPIGYANPNYAVPVQQLPPPPPGFVYAPAPVAALPAPRVSTTPEGKLDLRSLSAANPGYAMAGSIATPLTDWATQQQMRNVPQHYVDRSGRALAPTGGGFGYPPGYGAPYQQPYQQPMQQPMVDAWGRPVDQYGRPIATPAQGGAPYIQPL